MQELDVLSIFYFLAFAYAHQFDVVDGPPRPHDVGLLPDGAGELSSGGIP